MRASRAARVVVTLLILAAAFAPRTAAAAPNEVTSRSGHRYVQDGARWRMQVDAKDPDATVDVNTRRIVVRAVDGWSPAQLERDKAGHPVIVGRPLPGGYRTIDVPEGLDAFEYLAKLEADPRIEWARFDALASYFSTPNDPLFASQWGLADSTTRLPSAWNLVTGAPVKVAIIDSGMDLTHPDLLGAMDPASGQFAPPEPSDPHGTSVAGIIGARSNNATGVAGVATGSPTAGGASLLVLNVGASPSSSGIAAAIVFAADHGARVANLSLGMCTGDDATFPDIAAAIAYATDAQHDMVLVCASGNSCKYTAYPAKKPECIAVRAILQDGSDLGSWGPRDQVDVLAPGGTGIVTTDLTGDLGYSPTDYTCDGGPSTCFGGTSAAAPFVSGVVALMRATNPSLTRTQVYDILVHSADKLPAMGGAYSTYRYGYGKVNALGAIAGARYDAQLLQGTYTTAQTWPDPVKPFHNLYLSGDVLVGTGNTVNITPRTDIAAGTTCYASTTDAADLEPFFTDKVELISRGTLNVNGTASRRVLFRSAAASPAENDWGHLYAIAAGNLNVANADVQHSQNGVLSSTLGSVSVTGCTFQANQLADVKLGDSPASATISGSTFVVGGGVGVDLTGGPATLTGNTFSGMTSTATALRFEAAGKTATMTGNTITGSGTGTGFALGAGSATLRGNTVTGCARAMQVTSGPHVIGEAGAGNSVTGNGYGLYAQCSGGGTCPAVCAPLFATVRWNTFAANSSAAVYTTKTVGIDLGTAGSPGNNTITGSAPCLVNNASSCGTLNAQGNWWGACGVPTNLCGSIDITGLLCAPPGGAAPPADAGVLAAETVLRGAHPNPARDGTSVRFALGAASDHVSVTVYDVAGRIVRELPLGRLAAGEHEARWDGRDEQGAPVAGGVYFARLRGVAREAVTKVLVLNR